MLNCDVKMWCREENKKLVHNDKMLFCCSFYHVFYFLPLQALLFSEHCCPSLRRFIMSQSLDCITLPPPETWISRSLILHKLTRLLMYAKLRNKDGGLTMTLLTRKRILLKASHLKDNQFTGSHMNMSCQYSVSCSSQRQKRSHLSDFRVDKG